VKSIWKSKLNQHRGIEPREVRPRPQNVMSSRLKLKFRREVEVEVLSQGWGWSSVARLRLKFRGKVEVEVPSWGWGWVKTRLKFDREVGVEWGRVQMYTYARNVINSKIVVVLFSLSFYITSWCWVCIRIYATTDWDRFLSQYNPHVLYAKSVEI